MIVPILRRQEHCTTCRLGPKFVTHVLPIWHTLLCVARRYLRVRAEIEVVPRGTTIGVQARLLNVQHLAARDVQRLHGKSVGVARRK